MKSSVVAHLLYTNKILTSRLKTGNAGYWLIIFFGIICCIFYSLIILWGLKTNEQEKLVALSTLVYLVLTFDVFLVSLRFTKKTIIEPEKLIVYPISDLEKFKFYFLLLLIEPKNLNYLFVAIIFAIYYTIHYSFVDIFLAILVWILFFINIQVWIVTIYKVFEKLIKRYRKNLVYIGFLLVFLLQTLTFFVPKKILLIPIVGQVSKVLYLLLLSKDEHILSNFFLLLISLLICLITYHLYSRSFSKN